MKFNKHVDKHFTIIQNTVLEDTRLSWKAKGIFAYLWSKSDDWQYHSKEVATHSTDKIDSLRTGLNELKEAGYLKITQQKGKHGLFSNQIWDLYPVPTAISPGRDFPHTDKRHTENPTLPSTDSTKNLKNNSQASPDKTPYSEIINFLNQQTGKKFSPKSAKNREKIRARWHEGYTLDDFKKVIEFKTKEWSNPEGNQKDMRKFLRPETLFNEKFDRYLNEAPDSSEPQVNDEETKERQKIAKIQEYLHGKEEESSAQEREG